MIFITITSNESITKEQIELLFTDTDSLCYHIATDDVYEYFDLDGELFDNSDYNEKSKFYFNWNKKVIGKFKDETAGHPISGFAGLKSKMYSYTIEQPKGKVKNNKTAKGVKKNIIKRYLDHSDYLDCIQNNAIMNHKMKSIRSEYHQTPSYEINNVSLSCYDDKRYILDDGITSLAYRNCLSKKLIV